MKNPIKLLFADDSPTVQKVVELAFDTENVQIISALNGNEAWEKARASKLHMIVLDTSMPEMNGYELCKKLKAEPDFSDIPIFLLTSTSETYDKEKGQAAGANGRITKPFKSGELVELVISTALKRDMTVEAPPETGSEETAVPEKTEEDIGAIVGDGLWTMDELAGDLVDGDDTKEEEMQEFEGEANTVLDEDLLGQTIIRNIMDEKTEEFEDIAGLSETGKISMDSLGEDLISDTDKGEEQLDTSTFSEEEVSTGSAGTSEKVSGFHQHFCGPDSSLKELKLDLFVAPEVAQFLSGSTEGGSLSPSPEERERYFQEIKSLFTERWAQSSDEDFVRWIRSIAEEATRESMEKIIREMFPKLIQKETEETVRSAFDRAWEQHLPDITQSIENTVHEKIDEIQKRPPEMDSSVD